MVSPDRQCSLCLFIAVTAEAQSSADGCIRAARPANDFVWTEATGQVMTMSPRATNVDRFRENEDGLHDTGE